MFYAVFPIGPRGHPQASGVQTQTRRLQRIALLATRQEAEFVSGVLDAADVPHAIVGVDAGLELRVDPDDAERVRALIERLDVREEVAGATRQRRAEAAGRRIAAGVAGVALVGAGFIMAVGLVGVPRAISGAAVGLLLGIPGAALIVWAVALRARKNTRDGDDR